MYGPFKKKKKKMSTLWKPIKGRWEIGDHGGAPAMHYMAESSSETTSFVIG